MRKVFLTGMVALSLSFTMPVSARADEYKIATTSVAQEQKLETHTMYAITDRVNIRREPNIESDVLDQTLKNTSFEVVKECDEWSMITTNNGYAYIKSEYLSDTKIEISQYTENDLYVLAHVICGEAQGYPDDEQRYVGSVVLNRVEHPEFPDSIEGVVFQPGQYACVDDGNYYREPTEANWENAKWLLENGSVLPSNVIWQSRGQQGKGVYLKTKWHKYCY